MPLPSLNLVGSLNFSPERSTVGDAEVKIELTNC